MLEIFNIIARGYPMIIIIIVLGHFIGTKNPESLYLLVWLIIVERINQLFKLIVKYIFGKKDIPLLGRGERPEEAKNCGYIANGKKPTSYGMPSGHSHTAAFFSVYSILVINSHPISEGMKTSLAIILTALAFWIMYSRTIFKCHTIQQVLMGGILGSIFGVIAFNFKNIVLQKIK